MFFLLYGVGHHENHYAIDETQRPPTLFGSTRIEFADMQWVLEHKPRPIKANPVLCQVAAALLRIPGYPHLRHVRTVLPLHDIWPLFYTYKYVITTKFVGRFTLYAQSSTGFKVWYQWARNQRPF